MNSRKSKLFRIGDSNVQVTHLNAYQSKGAWLQAIGNSIGAEITNSDGTFRTVISSSTGSSRIFTCKGTEILNQLDNICSKVESIRISVDKNNTKKICVILTENEAFNHKKERILK